MKSIPTQICTAVLVLFGTCALSLAEEPKPGAGAGAGNGPGGRAAMDPEARAKMMKERLDLTDEQTAKVKAIYEKNQEKFKALREDTSLSQEDKRTKMREMFTATIEEVKPILTPEQQTKWKEEMDKRRAEGEKKKSEGGEKK